MSPVNMPPAEVEVDAALVRGLLEDQFPHWADLPITARPGLGWDNHIFRLGPDLLVRLPRRQLGADLVAHEHRWLPQLAPRLPLPVPLPVGQGVPGRGYPWPWSVCPWIPGRMAAVEPLSDPLQAAGQLGAFVAALHLPAPPEAPHNPFRSVTLAGRDEVARATLAEVEALVDRRRVEAAWRQALEVTEWDGPPVWLHGDLHPANLLVADGRLSGVIDFGDLCAGDPAVDVVGAWMLFPPLARPMFAAAVGVDDATWRRGRGWALAIGLACLAHSADNPVVAGMGRRAVEAVLEEAGD
ncbi:MAG TPA: aminoglycoside phosphotransferase family protein [Acidimicrobiales bacterium]|nr:aminoglycoside phosphotransferase family protein [Acidimicrobiales bacterium]